MSGEFTSSSGVRGRRVVGDDRVGRSSLARKDGMRRELGLRVPAENASERAACVSRVGDAGSEVDRRWRWSGVWFAGLWRE